MSSELFKDDLLYLTKQHQDDFYSFFKKFLQSNSNLIFCSTNPAIANYYSNFFEKKISNFENIKVEKFFPNDSETVIKKFNSILKEVSIEDSKQINKESTRKIFIIPDLESINPYELQLLSRIINDFPASNVNFITFVKDIENNKRNNFIDLVRKNTFIWQISYPDANSIRILKKYCIDNNILDKYSNTLKALGIVISVEESEEDLLGKQLDKLGYISSEEQKTTEINVSQRKPRYRKITAYLLFISIILLFSMALVLFFYKDDYSVDTKVSQLNVLDEKSREVIISDLEINDENVKPNLTEKINTSTEYKEETITETQEVVDETRLFRDSSLKTSIDWLNIQKPSHWLIQLSSFDTFNKAFSFSEKFIDIECRIVKYSHPKKNVPYYAVILGSFATLDSAKDFTKGKIDNVDPFYRTVKSLKIYIE
tara:strand:+ start:317 stop:1597 length:1281 start_codon:yes stop_codon:yes gene_type:complete